MTGPIRSAAEGGYQNFALSSADKWWLVAIIACGVIGIASGLLLVRSVLAADPGSPRMREIAKAIQEGAEAFLRRQFRTILIIVVPLAVLIYFTATKVVRPDQTVAMTFTQNGIWRAVCFLLGATFSGLTGFIGMSIAVRGNVRTAAAAVAGKGMPGALRVAFRTGAVTGLLCVGLGLTGAAGIFLIFQNSATAVLQGLNVRYAACEDGHAPALQSLFRLARAEAFRHRFSFLSLGLHERDPLRSLMLGIPRFTFSSLAFATSLGSPARLEELAKGVPFEDYALV